MTARSPGTVTKDAAGPPPPARDDARAADLVWRRRVLHPREGLHVALSGSLALLVAGAALNAWLQSRALHYGLIGFSGLTLAATIATLGGQREHARAWARDLGWIGVLALTALVWCFAQAIVPVPYSLAHPGWEIADAALGAQTDAFIALDRSRAIDQALQLCATMSICFVAFALGRRRERADFLFKGLGLCAIAYVAADLAASAAGRDGSALTPAVAGIGAIVCFSIISSRSGDVIFGRGLHIFLRSASAAFAGRQTAFLFGFALCLAALAFSHDLAALTAALAGLAFFAAASSVAAAPPRRMIALALALGFAAAAAFASFKLAAGGAAPAAHDALTRADLRAVAQEGLEASPWLGYGLGGFPAFADLVVAEPGAAIAHVRNDWLEFAFGTGAPAALALWAALALLCAKLLKGFTKRQPAQHFAGGGFAAALFVGLYGLAESSLTSFFVAALFSGVLGVAMAQDRLRKSIQLRSARLTAG